MDLDDLKQEIEARHGGIATHIQSVPVLANFEGEKDVCHVVHVFSIAFHHTAAARAYGWSPPIDGSSKRQYCIVLHSRGVTSPSDAVRMMADVGRSANDR